jgi:hypothetical protein
MARLNVLEREMDLLSRPEHAALDVALGLDVNEHVTTRV